MEYAELQVTSNFSFLRGGSHPEEIVESAIELGYKAIAIADYNTLAGIKRKRYPFYSGMQARFAGWISAIGLSDQQGGLQ